MADSERVGLTINDLPNEILEKILNYLNWKGQLRISLVAKRWFNLVDNNPRVMKKVAFVVDKLISTSPFLTDTCSVTRTYRNVIITRLRRLSMLPEVAIFTLKGVLANAEWVKFKTCFFKQQEDFERLVAMCTTAKIIEFDNVRVFNDDKVPSKCRKVEPTKVVMSYQTSFEVLDSFDKISELELRFRLSKQHFTELLARYGEVIKTLRVPQNNDALRQLTSTETLCLNNVAIYGIAENLSVALLRKLFQHQQTCITDLSVSLIDAEVFGLICGLSNLKRLSFERKEVYSMLGLKALKKLETLDLGHTVESSAELVISLGPTVRDICIRSMAQGMEYLMTSTVGPLNHVKRMWLLFANGSSVRMDQVAELFPNLEYLSVETTKGFRNFDINQLKCLKSASLDYMVVTVYFLAQLKANKLRDLGIVKYQHGAETVNDATLERLTANCPDLLRIFSEKWRGLRREPKLQLRRMLARRKAGVLRLCRPLDDNFQYDADSNDEDDF